MAVGRVALGVAAVLACGPRAQSEAPGPAPGRVCGRLPAQPVAPRRWQYEGVAGPSPSCDRAETTWANVPHDDRACLVDLDCAAVLEPGGCSYGPLNREAALRPEYAPVGCGDPRAGACPQQTPVARCVAGCCETRAPE
jgi:hypothetical protein